MFAGCCFVFGYLLGCCIWFGCLRLVLLRLFIVFDCLHSAVFVGSLVFVLCSCLLGCLLVVGCFASSDGCLFSGDCAFGWCLGGLVAFWVLWSSWLDLQ